MKKTLRNILALSLGLMTTIVSAQDWNADSRTRIDMSGDNDKMSTDQRVTLGTTWGGSDWGIHVSSDVNYTLGSNDVSDWGIYEAYASTDLMGYASLTAGRMAISNGSGALMSTRDWGTDRTTWEGMMFGLNLDMADITIGYHRQNTGVANEEDAGNTWINCAGEFSGWNVNLLYMTDEGNDDAATGIDISGEVAGAGVSASMNTDFDGDEMRVIGLSYAVNDDMGVNVSQTVYSDDNGFNMAGTNMSGADWSNGQMAYLNGGDEMLSYGLTYNMSGISLGATMHNVTSLDDSERDVTELSLGYSLGNNAGLSLSMVDDNDTKYMWLTINVGL
jgi:hypothetical protein